MRGRGWRAAAPRNEARLDVPLSALHVAQVRSCRFQRERPPAVAESRASSVEERGQGEDVRGHAVAREKLCRYPGATSGACRAKYALLTRSVGGATACT